MKIEFPTPPSRGLQWSTVALVTIGVGMLLFVAYGAGQIPISVALIVVGPIGIILILIALRRLRGKSVIPKFQLQRVTILLLIVGLSVLFFAMGSSTAVMLIPLVLLWVYVWLNQKGKVR